MKKLQSALISFGKRKVVRTVVMLIRAACRSRIERRPQVPVRSLGKFGRSPEKEELRLENRSLSD